MAEANETLVNQHEAQSPKSQPLHPLVELTLMRIREFLREREAVFWVFVFPVLMTFALGIAFRNTAPDKTLVAIEADAKASETANLLSHSPDITATVLTPDMARAQEAWRSLPVGTVKINAVFGGAPGGASEPRRASGNGFGFGPELLDEMSAMKVVHWSAPG